MMYLGVRLAGSSRLLPTLRLTRLFSDQNPLVESKKLEALSRKLEILKSSPTHLEVMNQQIKDLAKVDDYDTLIDTYKEDIKALSTDKFAKTLELPNELLFIRTQFEKKENTEIKKYNFFGVILLGISVAVCGIFYYKWDRTKIRMPKAIAVFWKLRLLSSVVYFLPTPEVQAQAQFVLSVIEQYVAADKEHHIKNGFVGQRILNILAQLDISDDIAKRYINCLDHILTDLQENKTLYQPNLDHRYLSDSIRSVIRRITKYAASHDEFRSTPIICKNLETLLQYLPESVFSSDADSLFRLEISHMFAVLKQTRVLVAAEVPENSKDTLKRLEWELGRQVQTLNAAQMPPKGLISQHVSAYLQRKLASSLTVN